MSIRNYWHWLAVGAVMLLGILVPFVLYEQAISEWTEAFLKVDRPWWLISVVLAGLLALDLAFPVPSSVVSTAAGYLLGPVGGTLVSWIGMSLGCLVGYLVGRCAGRPLILRFVGDADLRCVSGIRSRLGDWMVVVFRAVPVLAEASVVFAGIARLPFIRFAVLVSLSNLGIAATYAAVGAYSMRVDSFWLAFAGAVALPGLAILSAKVAERKN